MIICNGNLIIKQESNARSQKTKSSYVGESPWKQLWKINDEGLMRVQSGPCKAEFH